ncbi:MAG: class I SAM-dependent methyltransferase, partial [Gammaproteobacteria bacterium]
MTIGEKILTALSRDPAAPDYGASDDPKSEFDPDKSLALLHRVYPDFEQIIKGKRVLDFGCGTGKQAAALALGGAGHVVGLDTNERTLAKAV